MYADRTPDTIAVGRASPSLSPPVNSFALKSRSRPPKVVAKCKHCRPHTSSLHIDLSASIPCAEQVGDVRLQAPRARECRNENIPSRHIPSHPTFHLISSHRITSHHIAVHHITSHHIAVHHITSQHIAAHHITLHCITSHHIALHHITSHHII